MSPRAQQGAFDPVTTDQRGPRELVMKETVRLMSLKRHLLQETPSSLFKQRDRLFTSQGREILEKHA